MKTMAMVDALMAIRDDGESSCCVPIEATIGELGALMVGTCCGTVGNTVFCALAKQKGFEERLVRGWYDANNKTMCGMIHVQARESETGKIERIVRKNEGSMEFHHNSKWDGFMEFEIE